MLVVKPHCVRCLHDSSEQPGGEVLYDTRSPGRGRAAHHIEGLGTAGGLHPWQEGFWEEHGLQCGYCTPGMIMASAELLKRTQSPSDAEVREALEGNLCRCTGYQHIINAIQHAAVKMRARKAA